MYGGSGTAKRVGIEPANFAVSSTCLKIQGHISLNISYSQRRYFQLTLIAQCH
jgi:hypothetical protein